MRNRRNDRAGLKNIIKGQSQWRIHVAAALGAALCSGGIARAADTWAGSAGSTDWATPANWAAATVPVTGDSLIFGSSNASPTNTLTNTLTSTSFNISGITFSNGAPAYTLTGNAFSLTGNITSNDAVTTTIADNFVMTGASRSLSQIVNGNLIVSGSISGNFNLTLTQQSNSLSAFYTLSGSNTYVGNTSIGFNTVFLDSNSALGTGLLTSGNNAHFDNNSGNDAESLATAGLAVTSPQNFNGTNSIAFGAASTFAGALGVDTNTGASKTLTFNGTATMLGSETFTVNNTGSLVFNNTMAFGAFQLQKSGTGNMTLAAADTGAGISLTIGTGATYVSTMRINAGTVSIGNSAAFGTGVVDIRGATLLSTTDLSGANKLTNLFVNATGNPTIGGSNNIELGGGYTINNGAAAANTLNVTNSATTTISGAVSLNDATNTTNHTLTINATGGPVIISGAIQNTAGTGVTTGSMVVTGGGAVTFGGADTYTGATAVQNGSLQLTGSLVSSSMTLGAGTTSGVLILGGASGVDNLSLTTLATSGTGTGNAVVGGASSPSTLTLNNAANTTFNGALGGSGTNQNNLAFTKTGAGTLTLSGTSTYTGATIISAGTLSISGGGLSGTSGVSIASTATLAASGTVTAAGQLSLNSGGTLDLRGASTTSLSTNVLNFTGGTIDLNVWTGAVDNIASTGAASISGTNTINLSLPVGQSVVPGTYTLMTAASGLGSGFTLGTLPTGFYNFNLVPSANTEQLSITGAVTPVTAYWSGQASPGGLNWGSGSIAHTNWSSNLAGTTDTNQVPGATTNVIFTAQNAAGVSGALNTTLDVAYQVQSLTFDVPLSTGITSVSINTNGKNLTIGSGGITLNPTSNSSGTISGTGSVILATSETFANNGSTGLAVSSGISSISGATTLTVNPTSTGSINLDGGISNGGGTTSLFISSLGTGTGITELGGVNTYTGTTTLDTGSAVLNGKIGSGGGTVVLVGNSSNASVASLTESTSGVIAGTSTLTVTGAGSVTLNGTNTYTGGTFVNQTGQLTVANGSAGSTAATVWVSINPGDTGLLNVTGGILNAGQIEVTGNNYTGTVETPNSGTINQSGGVINATSNLILGQGTSYDDGTIIGPAGLPTGTYNLNGGIFQESGGALQIARGGGAQGVLNINGGAVKLLSNVSIELGAAANTFDGTINQSAGSVTFYSDAGNTVGGTGVLYLGFSNNTGLSGIHSSTYTYNLDGGTLTVPQIQANPGQSAVSLLNINGGTLKAAAANSNWIQNLTHVYVQSAGAVIDSGGVAVTIAQPLEQDPNSTGGGVTKQGLGSLTLTGSSTYAGATTVTGGSLILGGSGSLATSGITINGSGAKFVQASSTPVTAPITVTNGTLDGTGTVGTATVGAGTGGIVSNGNGTSGLFTIGTLTFTGAGGLSLIPVGGNLTTTAALDVTGTLSTAGTVTVNASPIAGFVNGQTYDLVDYGTFSGSISNFTLGTTFTPREIAAGTHIINDTANNAIAVVISGGGSLTWTGGGNANWDTASPSNWLIGGSATTFQTGDNVVFDDTATSTAVTLNTANVTPSSVIFNNNTKSYTVSSTGGFGIAGATTLVKNGTGTTTLATNNTYTGATIINGGTLALAGTEASTTTNINPSGTLQLNFASASSASNLLPSSSVLTMNGGTLSVIGKASTTNSQAVASTTISGGSAVTVTANATANPVVLNLATITRNAGASLVFTLPTGTQSATNGIVIGNAAPNGILGPWAVVSGSGTAAANSTNGYTYATNSSSGNVVAYTGATSIAAGASPSLDSQTYDNTPTVNYDDAETGAQSTNYGPNVNTMRLVNTAALTFTTTSNGRFLANGVLAAGTGGFTIAGNFAHPSTANEMVLDAASEPITVSAPIDNLNDGTTPATLTIMGPNTTTLTGANAYTGPTYVNGGTLAVSGTGSINASSGGIFVNGSGAKYLQLSSVASTLPLTLTQGTLDGTGTVGAVTVGSGTGGIVTNGNGSNSALTIGSLTFLGSATASIRYGGSPGVIVTGALGTNSAGGTQKVTINATGAFGLGNNDLISFGSLNGSVGDFTLGTVSGLNARASKSLVLDGSNIALNVVSDSPVWSGANGGIWTTNTANASNGTVSATPNWALANAHTPSDFWAGDIVQFNDTVNINGSVAAPTTTTVTIQGGSVSPTSATFNNSALNYTITSSDGSGITGTSSLTKNGTGSLTINTADTYSGGTVLNAGTLNIGNVAALGTGRLTLAGGTFDNTTGASAQVSNNILQTWSGAFTFAGTSSLNMGTGAVTLNGTPSINVSNNTLTVGGVISNGTGNSLIKGGAGTLSLTGISTFTGGTTVNGGTLSLGVGGGSGPLRGVLTINAGGTVVAAAGDAIGFTAGAQLNTININAGGVMNSLGGNQAFKTNFVLTGGTLSAASGAYQFDAPNGFGISSLAGSVTSLVSANLTDRTDNGSAALNFMVASGTTPSGIDLSVTGAVGGGPGIVKNGNGNLQLSGNNTFGTTTSVNAGTLTLASTTALPAASNLSIASGASVVANRNGGGRITVDLASLNNSGLIDLQNNWMVIHGSSSSTLATVFSEIQTGYNAGAWTGTPGTSEILSSTAASDPTHLTALGERLSGTDLSVHYTYYGDANLSGVVDGSDYSLIDNGHLQGLTGWQNGDFNYDGVINGSDYTLIDNAYNTQGASLASQVASPTAELAGSAASAVPEPTTLGLLGIGAIGLLGRRRRR